VTILGNPRFDTHALRMENSYQLADELGDIFAGRQTQEWVDILTRGGVAAMAPKTEPNNEGFHRDPVNLRIGRVAEVVDDNGVRTRESAVMVRVSDAVLLPHRLACALGEDTDVVLRDIGYTDGQIGELRQRESIR
jgi:crotonobetainyl-CoA:carnitine CoA-transferase CaiB-like acyl-CoA transferase